MSRGGQNVVTIRDHTCIGCFFSDTGESTNFVQTTGMFLWLRTQDRTWKSAYCDGLPVQTTVQLGSETEASEP